MLFLFFISLIASALSQGYFPEQVRVSWAGKPISSGAYITWATDKDGASVVKYGFSSGDYSKNATGNSDTYSCVDYTSPHLHSVLLSGLPDNTRVFYRVGDPSQGMSREFSFMTAKAVGPEIPIAFGVVGDMGQTQDSNNTRTHMLADPTQQATLHLGDMSYADGFQPRWDSWGRVAEPLSASRAYMVLVGNHDVEKKCDVSFNVFQKRFKTPNKESDSPVPMYYSLETASVHFLVLCSYCDYDGSSEQFAWASKDLANVDRSKTPWVVVMTHAPWYNSNAAHQGEGDKMMSVFEPLLLKYHVDLVLYGHVHAYERTARVAGGKIDEQNGIIHIVVGDGGNREGLASMYIKPQPAWSLFRQAEYGHGVLTIHNSTTAQWDWHRNMDQQNIITDSVVFGHAAALKF